MGISDAMGSSDAMASDPPARESSGERPRELLLFRHGIAAERAKPSDDASADLKADGERPLTALGRSRSRAVAEQLLRLGLGADRLLSSPLVRARQTAEIAVAAGLASRLELDGALAPGGDPLPLVLASRCPRLMLVGHEPDLGQLACRLLGAPAGAIQLKKAGLALIVLTPLPSLRLLLTPRLLLSLTPGP
jgi:phosphohistidine phosphatase